jgi:sterol desaturase/sphingolipid hydroxylase (fatty acid hydroxylase superfamily)
MTNFLLFFEDLSNLHKLIWIFLCMGFFYLLESISPLLESHFDKWRHTKTNFVFLSTTVLINALFGILTASIFLKINNEQWGLLNLINLPIWAEIIIAVMFLDFFAQFFTHYLLHKVKFLWRFHMVHHSDTNVDVTTGTRHHPGDYIIRECFSLVAIIVLGMPFSYYVLYRILTIFFTYFTHANLALPSWLDRLIGYVFVTPRMHKFHHHDVRPWTDSNFGNMFSVWDRLFGTMVDGDHRTISYGVDILNENESDSTIYQMKVPFDSTIKTGI